jgi:OmpA-OmpF porin, OOP family
MESLMRRCMTVLSLLVLGVTCVSTLPRPLDAQGALGRVRQRAADEAKRRAEEKANRAVDKTLDGVENAISCVVGDQACLDRAAKSGKTVVLTEADGTPVSPANVTRDSAAGEALSPAMRPGEGAWANYDFVPGERPLRIADFAGDAIGDFPRRLEAFDGNFEVVEWRGDKWLRATGRSNRFLLPADGPLPSRWTLEFELLGEEGECWIYPSGAQEGGYLRFGVAHTGGLVRSDGRDAGTRITDGGKRAGAPFTARAMVDGRYVKAYVHETRVVNIPNFDYTAGDALMFYCDGTQDNPLFLRNIRFAAGGRRLYDALAESGRVATQGVYFDTGSDRLRPESTPTLKEIGAMLTEHPELRLTIEGHTDNTGSAPANLALSQQRADAVRAHLISAHGIAPDRLEAKGLGQANPVAPNTTVEGRQQNRRVELVKRD